MTAKTKTVTFEWDHWVGFAELQEAYDQAVEIGDDSPVVIHANLDSFLNPARTVFTIKMGHLRDDR